jgi:hypothetical protein
MYRQHRQEEQRSFLYSHLTVMTVSDVQPPIKPDPLYFPGTGHQIYPTNPRERYVHVTNFLLNSCHILFSERYGAAAEPRIHKLGVT